MKKYHVSGGIFE